MNQEFTKTKGTRDSSRSVTVLILSALFVALSIILGKQLSFTAGPFRISFENLTVLMAGIFFGPAMGAIVGACADLIGCLIVGYTINPLITAGAASIGFVAGLIWKLLPGISTKKRIFASVGSAHVIGSMIIKSIGLHIYLGFPPAMLALRIPLYIVIGALETYLILLLLRNKEISRLLERSRKS